MLVTINFQPGIVQDDSELVSENTFADGDKIRFRRNYAQPIGGWESAGGGAFEKPVRGAHAWAALTGDRVVAFGTADKLHSFFGGSIKDITPDKAKGTLTNPFTTIIGSDQVLVTDIDHGLKIGDVATYSNADPVGGLTIAGPHPVTNVLTIDQYVIRSTQTATSDASGGGSVEFSVPLDAGLVDGVGGTGFGTGSYGVGTFGLASGGDINPRVWSIDNWGQNGVFVPRNGALYEWQPLAGYGELIRNGSFENANSWSTGTGWTIADGKATATAGAISAVVQNLSGVLTGGIVYEVSVDVTVTAGSLQLRVESSDIATGMITYGEPIKKSGTYTRRFRADSRPSLLGYVKDAAFAGSIDNISVRVASKAYRIQSAPAYSTCMFVDPARFVVCCGTLEADGDFNGLLVRWSDQEDLESWIPDTDNVSGEYLLARGSRIVGALPGRGQNLIWTDDALYTMRFVGTTSDVFRFDLAGTGCGLIGKNAAIEHQGMVFWWARNGQFYIFQGGEPKVIPSTVSRAAWANLSASQGEKIYAAVNSEFNEIWWFYPDTRDGNECSRYVCYNWADGIWMTGKLPRTAWISAGVYAHPIGFGADGKIYFHERGKTANGATIDWRLLSGKFDIQDGDNLFRISKYVPDFEDQVGNVEVTLRFSQWSRGQTMSEVTRTITPGTSAINLRQIGRQCQIEWTPGANAQFARWGAQRFDVEKTGARR
jgi:hypothetical protein